MFFYMAIFGKIYREYNSSYRDSMSEIEFNGKLREDAYSILS